MEKDISLLTQICESAKAQRNLHAKLIHHATDDALLKALASQFRRFFEAEPYASASESRFSSSA